MDPAPAESELLLPELEGGRQTVLLDVPLNLAAACLSSDLRGRRVFWPLAAGPPLGGSTTLSSSGAPSRLSPHSSP